MAHSKEWQPYFQGYRPDLLQDLIERRKKYRPTGKEKEAYDYQMRMQRQEELKEEKDMWNKVYICRRNGKDVALSEEGFCRFLGKDLNKVWQYLQDKGYKFLKFQDYQRVRINVDVKFGNSCVQVTYGELHTREDAVNAVKKSGAFDYIKQYLNDSFRGWKIKTRGNSTYLEVDFLFDSVTKKKNRESVERFNDMMTREAGPGYSRDPYFRGD